MEFLQQNMIWVGLAVVSGGMLIWPLIAGGTVASLTPMLFAVGPGSEVQRPLAVVVIGGLLTSTALTLIILPVLYAYFSRGERPA